MEVKSIIKKSVLCILELLHLKKYVQKMTRRFLKIILPPRVGMSIYSTMQTKQYKKYSRTYEDAKTFCVGAFEDHEAYPYEEYLLEKYTGVPGHALDFGCGMGRMMKRMLDVFAYIDGADLIQENIDYAKCYLTEENQIAEKRYHLFKTDGLGCKITVPHKYDFIYSTICLQHIAVHKIRYRIFSDLHRLLKDNGQCCFQMGFGWDNGVHWFDNEYGARSTNAGLDVCIPERSHLPVIEKDFKGAGFKKVEFTIKPSPHTSNLNTYHPSWIFIHLWK